MTNRKGRVLSLFLAAALALALLPGLSLPAYAVETAITKQPESAVVTVTYGANFTVTAQGDNVKYQWEVNSGAGFTAISGATSATYSIGSCGMEMNNYQYRVKVTGDDGVSLYSNTVTLSVVIYSTPENPNSPLFPGSSDGKTGSGGVQVSYTLDGATHAKLDLSTEDKIISGLNAGGVCLFDLTNVSRVKSCEVTGSLIQKLAEKGVSLSFKLPQGSVTLDQAALKSLTKNTLGQSVTFTVAAASAGSLSAKQNEAAGIMLVMEVSVKNGSTLIAQIDGSVEMGLPYTLQAGEMADGVNAWHVNYEGVKTSMKASYDFALRRAVFKSNAFPYFIVGFDANKGWDNPFTDVLEGEWFYPHIEFVLKQGLFTGTTATTFSPRQSMSRGMFATVLGRFGGVDVSGYQQSRYTDVAAGMYYLGYIEWATEKGIAKASGEGTFAPDQSITREEMAYFLYHYAIAMGQQLKEDGAAPAFTDDAAISEDCREAVHALTRAGVLTGRDSGAFDPKGSMQRCEAAAVLERYVSAVSN